MHGSDAGEQQLRLDIGRRQRLPLSIDDPVPISALSPAWRRAAQAATVGIFIILFFVALSLARPILLPTAAAFVVTMLLSPLSERADRYRVPALVTAIVLWLAVVAAGLRGHHAGVGAGGGLDRQGARHRPQHPG